MLEMFQGRGAHFQYIYLSLVKRDQSTWNQVVEHTVCVCTETFPLIFSKFPNLLFDDIGKNILEVRAFGKELKGEAFSIFFSFRKYIF